MPPRLLCVPQVHKTSVALFWGGVCSCCISEAADTKKCSLVTCGRFAGTYKLNNDPSHTSYRSECANTCGSEENFFLKRFYKILIFMGI